MRVYLVDNGSLRAESVLNLRCLAASLGDVIGCPVIAASLLHSSRIPAEELGGEPAINWERRLRTDLEAGERDFVVVPLFFGPTGAIVDYMPQRLNYLRERFGEFRIERTPFMHTGEPEQDAQLLDILEERVLETMQQFDGPARVVLVDHGSPLPAVTAVRNELAAALGERLGDRSLEVRPASMERREGDEYAFNEPLLESVLRRVGWCASNVVVAMLFLSPGRHAGSGGDVDQICKAAEADHPQLRTRMTGLVATHAAITGLLAARWRMPRVGM